MAVHLRELIWSAHPRLRVHPVEKWVRATWGETLVVSSRRPMLVWEPRRVVASYAVPREDVAGELVPHTPDDDPAGEEHPVRIADGESPVLDPRTPFSVHSCPGTSLTLRTADGDLPGAAFAPDDEDLAGYVVLDWRAFTQWYEEDEPVHGAPARPVRPDRLPAQQPPRHDQRGRAPAGRQHPAHAALRDAAAGALLPAG